MARTSGYLMTVKLFLPAPKTDFKAQAAAATMADDAKTSNKITPELIALARVMGVDAKFTSVEDEAPPAGNGQQQPGAQGDGTTQPNGGGEPPAGDGTAPQGDGTTDPNAQPNTAPAAAKGRRGASA